ncbi:MAG: hypothetical protein Q7U57_12690 [Methylovulum sp.]|nr:hypothetical protein [Methylovulum sp.]
MNYIINFFSILSGTTQLLISHNRMSFAILLLSGLLLASLLWMLCAFFGRLFYKAYRLSIGQHILCGLLAILVILTVPTYASIVYLQPSFAEIIRQWHKSLVDDGVWQNKLFKSKFNEIKKMGLEDFSTYQDPAKGGTKIPVSHTESKLKWGQMDAEATIENFNTNFPLLSKIIGAKENVSADTVSQDINNYLKANPGSDYLNTRGIKLAVDSVYNELKLQIPHIIFVARLSLVLLVVICYTLLLIWIGYSSLRKIRIYSAHTTSSTHS